MSTNTFISLIKKKNIYNNLSYKEFLIMFGNELRYTRIEEEEKAKSEETQNSRPMVSVLILPHYHNGGIVYHEDLFYLLGDSDMFQDGSLLGEYYLVKIPEDDIYKLSYNPDESSENKVMDPATLEPIEFISYFCCGPFEEPWYLWYKFNKKVIMTPFVDGVDSYEVWIHPSYLSRLERTRPWLNN